MKKIVFVIIISMLSMGCKTASNTLVNDRLLKNEHGWIVKNIDKEVTHYQFNSQYYPEYNSFQNVNVLAFNPNNEKYKIKFVESVKEDSLSSIANKLNNAIFGINGTYYENSMNKGKSTAFFKSEGRIVDSVQIEKGTQFYWKHEGAFYSLDKEYGIVRGDNKVYKNLKSPNVMSGSPLLIENYHLSGTHFVRDIYKDLNSLEYENPDRHQGVRHPRTAIAIMENGTVLFITVDGRNKEKAAGMSAKELTLFLKKYFNPKYALNLDGGGSTTFWLKNSDTKNGVINYPTDNKRYDHFGQRKIKNALVLVKE